MVNPLENMQFFHGIFIGSSRSKGGWAHLQSRQTVHHRTSLEATCQGSKCENLPAANV